MGRGHPQAASRCSARSSRLDGRCPHVRSRSPRSPCLLVWVGSGQFFRMTGEGRTIGFGEDALWFPHQAAKFAGKAGNAQPFSVVSQRSRGALRVLPWARSARCTSTRGWKSPAPTSFAATPSLEKRIKNDTPGWEAELAEMERPVILADHFYNYEIGGTLFRSDHWRCVWFDAIAAVFVHDSSARKLRADAVDFAARHFRADRSRESRDRAELIASSKAIAKYVIMLGPAGGEKTRPLAWLGLDDTRQLLRQEPDSVDGWTNLGVIELFRELPREPVARFRAAFDPIYDLSIVRATSALRHALELARATRCRQHAENRL